MTQREPEHSNAQVSNASWPAVVLCSIASPVRVNGGRDFDRIFGRSPPTATLSL